MTCIVSAPQNGWSTANSMNFNAMNSEADGTRNFVPRKSVQRSNSSSSIASNTSSTSTLSATSNQSNGVSNGDSRYITSNPARKYNKGPVRGILPSSSKAEPVAGLSDTRSQSVPAQSGQSAASSISALQSGPQPQPHTLPNQHQPNGIIRGPPMNQDASNVLLQLRSSNGTFEPKSVVVPIAPDVVRIGRQTNQKTLPTSANGYFDSKVLSRQHAEVWADRDGRVWVRDVKSSNGTFVNKKRLSQENRDSDPHPLNRGDELELGIDIISEDQKQIVHHKVAAIVDHAGPHASVQTGPTMEYGELDAGPVNGAVNQGPMVRGRQQAQSQTLPETRYNGSRGQVPNVTGLPGFNTKMQPVSIEQIVKRLNIELKQARHQSSSLNTSQTATQAMGPQRQVSASSSTDKAHLVPNRSTDSFKARVASAPPAPPPSQPLPEAPTDAMIRNKLNEMPSIPPVLKRSDTEKPKNASYNAGSSPTKPENNSQILSLLDRLNTAQSEITIQGQKLNEMEDALNSERESRRSAEERAARLENASRLTDTSAPTESRDLEGDETPSEDSKQLDSDLQRRAELMRTELDEMKVLMAQYRQRAETAENESKQDRQSLSEMVETLQRKEEAEQKRDQWVQSLKGAEGPDEERTEHDHAIQHNDRELQGEVERAKTHLHKRSESDEVDKADLPNGAPKHPFLLSELQQLEKETLAAALEEKMKQEGVQNHSHTLGSGQHALVQTKRQAHLAQSAPYASMVGVVVLGLGIMAYLNGWQKVTDR